MGSTYLSSPDEMSPYYPERYIRPLPRRSIRSRLSVEAAETISYPPNPPSASLPAYSHYGEEEEFHQNEGAKRLTISQDYDHEQDSLRHDRDHDPRDCPYRSHEPCPLHHDHDHDHDHDHHHDLDHDHVHDHEDEDDGEDDDAHDDEDDDDLDSIEDVSPIAQRQANLNRTSPRSPRAQRHGRYNSYGGKSSSALDGYEAFENTNNKKKRKIPTSGSMNVQQGNLSSEFSQMGLASRDHSADDLSMSPNGLGVGGAGRGRANGRRSSTRNPLGPATNGINVRAGPNKYESVPPMTPNGDGGKTDQGIISKAIANATTLLRNPMSKGQEHTSGGVLDQQARTPTNSQFTFTCESDAKGVKFPEQSLYSPDYAHRVNSAPAAAPSQIPRYANPNAVPGASHNRPPPPQQHGNPPLEQQPAPKQRPRRRKGDVYTLAARQRKLQQEYTNLQHPPSHEDIWICEFCEYESIFGSPPRALVRQYEIKDRRERKRLAEKRRLLEKAKLKGRKGKKQTKNAAKAANSAAQQPINQQNYDDQPLDQMDDYLDEGYDDDPVPMPAPPPQAPSKQPMPGAYDRGGVGGGIGRSVSDPAAIDRGGTVAGTVR